MITKIEQTEETFPKFTKSSLNYLPNDPKYTNFRTKKVKMCDSFLAAKAKISFQTKNKSQQTQTRIKLKEETVGIETDKESTCSSQNNDTEEEESKHGTYICKYDDCNKVYDSRKELRRHKLIHRERKHVCPIHGCGRGFFEKSKLKRHMVVHTKKKEYACNMCGKKFGYKANVKTHMRTHTGERPFGCRIKGCNKSFAQASNRNAHEKTHKTPEEQKELAFFKQETSFDSGTIENETFSKKRKIEETVRKSTRISNRSFDLNSEATEDDFSSSFGIYNGISEQKQCLDFHEVAQNVGRDTITDTNTPLIDNKKSLYSEAQTNNLYCSFTSFGSAGALFSETFGNELGLSIDAFEHDINLNSLDDPMEGYENNRMCDINQTLGSAKNSPSMRDFEEKKSIADLSPSFLSNKL